MDSRRRLLQADFARAIDEAAFHLLAQPEVALASDAIVGIEIVPTWKSAEGVLGPSQIAGAVWDPQLRLAFDRWLVRRARPWQALRLPLLQRLLPDRVEIHRSFVRNAAGDPERSALARSIIALAHTLGIDVVADGIATELDLQFFKWEGCDVGQGDLLARSVAVADVAALLGTRAATTH